ncbi:hypothetical protein MIND_00679000 [Mycena indigotica]|uniref:Uncharacterized protein n=1 Tax=Mycena indigotica TaxID=2126181 RepID=A0A8H6SKM8_9AGAR|nr:uncharacterized protein MIND_00679000 [Mycena indigotica]KAF7301146.1 hypothetical protein MIND_00679000 [Mycena indigotica]
MLAEQDWASFRGLHRLLWPSKAPSDELLEPPELTKFIDSAKPFEPESTNSKPNLLPSNMLVEDQDFISNQDIAMEDDSIEDEEANDVKGNQSPNIRYVNPLFAPSVGVRDEYLEAFRYIFFTYEPSSPQIFRRFFITGQPGIGKSCFACYLLFRLLALGKTVFFYFGGQDVCYFDQKGAHSADFSPRTNKAAENLSKSWVVIDVEDTKWEPPAALRSAYGVVWTSSPQEERMKGFKQKFGGKIWYMKTWSSEETQATRTLLGLNQNALENSQSVAGPIPRALWGIESSVLNDTFTIDQYIGQALQKNMFGFASLEDFDKGAQPMHRVFRIEPLVVENNGQLIIHRSSFSTHFLSSAIVRRIPVVAQAFLQTLKGQLAAAFDIPGTRSLAGKVFEGLMHHAILNKKWLPDCFGSRITASVDLVGQFDSFTTATDPPTTVPLYLLPNSLTFAAVDSIIVTHSNIGLVQVAVGETHSYDFAKMLRLLSRLKNGARIDVDKTEMKQFMYCLVGSNGDRVRGLVAAAQEGLDKLLRAENGLQLAKGLGRNTKLPDIWVQRLKKLTVVGYTFDPNAGFTRVFK